LKQLILILRLANINELITNNITIANQTLDQYITQIVKKTIANLPINNSQQIVSPIIGTDQIQSASTSGNLVINLNKTTSESSPNSTSPSNTTTTVNNTGQLAKLIIKGLKGKTVATIDAEGNASLSGELMARGLKSASAEIKKLNSTDAQIQKIKFH